MTINELIKTAHEDAKAKGWWDEERNTGELLMLIVSECGEALEAHRKDMRADLVRFDRQREDHYYKDNPAIAWDRDFPKWFKLYIKDTFEDELADIVIRIADLCGSRNWELSPLNVMGDPGANVGEELLLIASRICDDYHHPSVVEMNTVVTMVWALANAHNIDLWKHIELKLAYNRTRPHKHAKLY